MGGKPRLPAVRRHRPPIESARSLLQDVAEALGPCVDGCPTDAGWCLVCRCKEQVDVLASKERIWGREGA